MDVSFHRSPRFQKVSRGGAGRPPGLPLLRFDIYENRSSPQFPSVRPTWDTPHRHYAPHPVFMDDVHNSEHGGKTEAVVRGFTRAPSEFSLGILPKFVY